MENSQEINTRPKKHLRSSVEIFQFNFYKLHFSTELRKCFLGRKNTRPKKHLLAVFHILDQIITNSNTYLIK